ncbi:copper transporter [Pengzhenrongella sicca]|uniref:Copper transporter n=1 Tax=Pengzhenrongella sicca TaxID=2819238 RepID=A0A8A4ZHH2_9MICO|nr:copper transporter [Pengzhenrongella sicca]QTE30715.1 copper transporter [Pengzhenrongella sicca]
MIDFRYHIVSLISVFIALAVGIALGAGPLKEAIGDTLTGQVQALRSDRDALRADLTAAEGAQAEQRSYLEAAGPTLVSGALTDRRVAVISLPGADSDDVAAVEAQLAEAGATVSGRVSVTDNWTDPSLRSFRQALAGNLVPYVLPAPAEDAGTEVELAEALAEGLTGADPAAPDSQSESAGLIIELLANADSALITVADEITAPADAIVIVTGAPADEDSTSAPVEDVVAAQVAIADAAQNRTEGAVVATADVTSGDLVSTIANTEELASSLSTVSGMDQVTGQLSVPLALNARIGGTVGHFGFGDNESPFPERTTLGPVDRTPAQAEADPASVDGAGVTG